MKTSHPTAAAEVKRLTAPAIDQFLYEHTRRIPPADRALILDIISRMIAWYMADEKQRIVWGDFHAWNTSRVKHTIQQQTGLTADLRLQLAKIIDSTAFNSQCCKK